MTRHLSTRLSGALLLTFGLVPVHAQTAQPLRTVAATTLTSTHDPAVRIELPTSVQYVGATRWPLYGVADCELHAFVQADTHKLVQRSFWIQFEAYLPSKPDLHYGYDSPRHVTVGGLDFVVDTWARASDASTNPGSDREHIDALIHGHGFTLPAGMVSVRLVHLLDAGKRRELMIIYSEAIPTQGPGAADLQPDGKARAQWPAIEQALIAHATESISIQPLATP